MVAEASRAPLVRERTSFAQRLRRFFAPIEPWYDWGLMNVDRMEGSTLERDSGWGDVRYVQLQWLGIHIGFQIGRTPKAVRS